MSFVQPSECDSTQLTKIATPRPPFAATPKRPTAVSLLSRAEGRTAKTVDASSGTSTPPPKPVLSYLSPSGMAKLQQLDKQAARRATGSYLKRVPIDVILRIFLYLSKKDLVLAASRVCPAWKALSRSKLMWNTFELARLVEFSELPIISVFHASRSLFATDKEQREAFWLRQLYMEKRFSDIEVLNIANSILDVRSFRKTMQTVLAGRELKEVDLSHCQGVSDEILGVLRDELRKCFVEQQGAEKSLHSKEPSVGHSTVMTLLENSEGAMPIVEAEVPPLFRYVVRAGGAAPRVLDEETQEVYTQRSMECLKLNYVGRLFSVSTFNSVLQSLPHLRVLELAVCEALGGVEFGNIFLLCPVLESLDLRFTTVSDESFNLGGKFVEFTTGMLLDRKIGDAPRRELRLLIEQCTGHATEIAHPLRKLNLSGCRSISDTTMTYLARHFPSIEELHISSCASITNSGLKAYCAEMRISREDDCESPQGGALRSIVLDGCPQISDEGFLPFLESAASRPFLYRLSMDGSQVGGEALRKVLSDFPSLSSFSCNQCLLLRRDMAMDSSLKRLVYHAASVSIMQQRSVFTSRRSSNSVFSAETLKFLELNRAGGASFRRPGKNVAS